MTTNLIKLDNGNAGTIAVYNEKESSIFWSKQSTNCYNEEKNNADSFDESLNSFDKNLKGVLNVPKPSSKQNK